MPDYLIPALLLTACAIFIAWLGWEAFREAYPLHRRVDESRGRKP